MTSHLVIAALQSDGPLPVAALPATVAVLAESRPDDSDYDNDNDKNDDGSLLHGGGRGGGHAVSLALAHVHIILAGPDQLLPLGVFLLTERKVMLQFNVCKVC